ncbi:MAG: UDP-N-acetylmuramate dehydrogenase [Lewinellaceae bacterium]|nr:UDP-N-acetylmuramate dehydrogenase [Saprospiraceae bacterium]MCB9340825.1 UDP-N-acetylmuramate dehydrogenase [Lewinellaceae bacterium]
MQIIQHYPLKRLNTFGLNAFAERFCEVKSVEELAAAALPPPGSLHILGGGSNILLTADLPGLVIKNNIGGINIFEEDDDSAIVAAGGGVGWHELVLWSLHKNLGGLENLSLIPGSVGAAPIQNIGAYGVELKDVFHQLDAFELATGNMVSFDAQSCRFGYRDSVFKNECSGKYCITKVFLKLSKHHQLRLEYGDIRRTLEEMNIADPTIQDVSKAVIHIRQSKLPDPEAIGNAGSFFKNPEIMEGQLLDLQKKFPGMVHYPTPTGTWKIPAGWLIEQAGWKGKRFGDAGCHTRQALVLVNYGNARGAEILDLARRIQESVVAMFGIHLSPEVNIWGTEGVKMP